MNEFIRLTEKQDNQSSRNPRHDNCVTACAYRCPESTIIQLRGTIDYVVNTQHYENKKMFSYKTYENTYTKHDTEKRGLYSL